MIMKTLESKSNNTAIVAAIVNLFALLNEHFQWFIMPEGALESANVVLGTLWAIFMRQGVAKSGPEAQTNVAQKGP